MHILCGVDGSGSGRAVADVAAQLADRIGGELTLTNVTPAAASELDALADAGGARFGRRPDVRVVHGDDAAAWLAVTARELACDLVVVGATRRARRRTGASPAGAHEALVEQLGCPVVVPPGAASPIGERIAVAHETSDTSAGAAAVAARLATSLEASLTVIHVLADPRRHARPVLPMHRAARDDVEAALAGEALALRHVSAYRLPAVHLARTVAEVAPALLVVPTARPRRRDRFRPPVSAQVLRRASCPVVLVPRAAAMRPEQTTVAIAA